MRRFEHWNRRRPENQAAPALRFWSAVGAVRRFNPRLQDAANEAVISGGPAFVAMMQSANFGERNDVALTWHDPRQPYTKEVFDMTRSQIERPCGWLRLVCRPMMSSGFTGLRDNSLSDVFGAKEYWCHEG